MKLLREFVDAKDLVIVSESVEGSTLKNYYLKGPFLQANLKNKNGRRYMRETLNREVSDYYTLKIKTNRSIGELDHPESPSLNLDRISHIITDLSMDGDVGMGCAKVLDTPMGKIAKALIDGGVQLGMSTRGVGSLDGENVKDDYKLITVDIVADPSAPTAFVEGVLESKEYIISNTGDIVESAVRQLERNIDKAIVSHKFCKKDFSGEALNYLSDFLKSIV